MAHSVQLACFLVFLAGSSAEKDQSRWSRQISSYTADISDWVPLPGPVQREQPQIKRQIAEPRILSEPFPGFARPTGFSQDTFPSRMFINSPANRQLYLQSVPSAPQNFLTDQGFGQSIRFGLAQPNMPINNVFVAPQYNFDTVPLFKSKPTPIPTTQIKFDNIPSIPIQNQHLAPQSKPFIQSQKTKPELPKFVDGYRIENITRDTFNTKKQSIPKIKFENYEKTHHEPIPQSKAKVEREEVQLLYVPLESLNRGQFNFRNPGTTSQLVNTELFSNARPNPLKQNLAAEFQNPPENYKPTQQHYPTYNSQLNEFEQAPKFMTLPTPIVTIPTTTPRPKKLKPHQPPLAIFLTQEAKKTDQIKVGDVLYSLKNANTVAVLDSVNPINAPKVFIGPNSLTPPENYVKFELPYLSNIEHSDKKLRQLPFFVAPLSYNTPQGFAKIPFPSPHVGSVVINSQIRETSPPVQPSTNADVIPNSYTAPPQYKPKIVTQKPRFSYYSTVTPKPNIPSKHEPNYYSFEPQTVSTLRPVKEPETSISTSPPKSGSYFLNNVGNPYGPSQYVNFPQENDYRTPDYNLYKTSETTTTRTTTPSTTTKPPSTYPSQLLETHNPYSINQAFHFSTPVDYQNFFDEYKETYATSKPGPQVPIQQSTSPQQPTEKSYEVVPEKPTSTHSQPSPTPVPNYTPEIHYESEIQHSRYPTYNTNEYTTKSEPTPQFEPSSPVISNENNNYQFSNENNNYQPEPPVISEHISQPEDNVGPPPESNTNSDNRPPIYENLTEPSVSGPETIPEEQTSKAPYDYNQYETVFTEEKEPSSTSTTTSTTTRRPPLRSRGRPRYSTTKSDYDEYSTRSPVTRRPLRERRPLPPRPKYEPNKITTEKATRKPFDSSESTTRSYRTRSRGRVHYKPSEADDTYDKRNKQNSKEADLAYQRDVLHQNYPVTLMERMSTVDIEAITEPTLKASSTNNLDSTNPYDTDNAYSNDQLSITQNTQVYGETKQDTPEYSKTETEPEETYVPRVNPTHSEDYIYHSRSSAAPVDAFSSYDETKEEQDNYSKQTTPLPKTENLEDSSPTKLTYTSSEHDHSFTSDNGETPTVKNEEETAIPEVQDTNIPNQEVNEEQEEPEENIVHTTPSYNRVRVRPGVIRQYHQASSTESSRTKNDRRKSAQAITYRPAFDRRRTTMRIDEIQADLKTKQVLIHPETQDVHPVYKPDPTTESSAPPATQDSASKRGQFRRRRPTYTHTTTTEASSTKKSYELKNRFRGRRPTTEKPTEKPEVQTDVSTSTTKSNIYNRYSHRPRLSERFQKKTESTDETDQESNYSLHRPKYAVPDSDHWSPKFSSDSFKPYNPNDVSETSKSATTDQKSNNDDLDIITAKNEYDDILISVTPATNNKASKIPDIPPTLEALVEQSKITKSESGDAMSTFETMLEEVMKSLDEQDQDEYTKNVMKHKGGEIGEIPPEKIISSGESYSFKSTTPLHEEPTTNQPNGNESSHGVSEEDATRKSRRRGFWKKVKVRPVTESIEVAESQYYHNTVNRLGQNVESKGTYGKSDKNDKPRVTTYKPSHEFMKNLFENEDSSLDILVSHMEIPKINSPDHGSKSESLIKTQEETTKRTLEKMTTLFDVNPGDMDLGTGSPDPTLEDEMYFSEPTEATINESSVSVDRSDGFSLMDYLFGVTSSDETELEGSNKTDEISKRESEITTKSVEIETTTEQKPKIVTTESTYIPEEITAELTAVEYETTESESKKAFTENVKQESTENPIVKVESSSISSFIDPANVVSTSMSTEVSHETEICFRGKCIKTNKDVL
ncbi:uncharacterized protein [Epargyreus clarus]|uniref:uncharacterized protein n=1 Tax=Epargyreus clarus TaxID=520877 RepID=UPI003C2EE9D4